jgi:ethanolamine permease
VMRGASPNAGLRLAVIGLLAVVSAVVSAHGARWIGLVILGAAPLLLMALYVFATEANSRIPGDSVVAWWVRLVVPALGVVAVVKPLADSEFASVALATVVAAAVGVGAALAVAALVARPGSPTEKFE